MGRFLSVETFDVSANGTQTAPVLFVTEPAFVLPPSGVPGSVSLRNPPNQTMAPQEFLRFRARCAVLELNVWRE